jgi:hypothetical protein
MRERYEVPIPNGRIIIKTNEKNSGGPFARLTIGKKTTELLSMATRLSTEAVNSYKVEQKR